MSSEHSSKYIYSEDQIAAYFSHVSFPTTKYGDTKDLSYLTTLQRHQLAHVPFENLSLHYSSHRTLSLDKDDLFVKFVPTNRGGYCMENNLFFATVLRTLGFEVIATGARVGSSGWWAILIFPGCYVLAIANLWIKGLTKLIWFGSVTKCSW